MLFLFWFVLVFAGSCLFLFVPALYGWTICDRYSGGRMVTCLQTHGAALVRFDATHAAFTGIFSKEMLRLAASTLWPQHLGCGQECMGGDARFRGHRRRPRKPAQSSPACTTWRRSPPRPLTA
jgi:hypothetical protein